MSLNFILILNVIALSLNEHIIMYFMSYMYVYLHTQSITMTTITIMIRTLTLIMIIIIIIKFVMGVFPLQNCIDLIVSRGVATNNASLYRRLLTRK